MLRGHEAIDELVELPRGWLKSLGGVMRLRRRLRELRFDVAVDLQALTKSALAARLSGAKRRIGFGGAASREFSRLLNNDLVRAEAVHVIDRYLELLRPLGIESPGVEFRLPEHEPDRTAAEEIVRRAGLQDGFAIVNAGAGWPSKLWPAERYGSVAQYMGRELGLPTLIVWGSPAEREEAERIAAASEGHARPGPPTTLPQLAALARRARLFIGSDTGPLHLAAAVGTPCVGLYGPWPAETNGPYGPRNISLQEMVYRGSTRGRRTASPKYMEAIQAESVCWACEQIIVRGGRNAA